MRPDLFRGTKWRPLHRWLATLVGVSFIVYIARVAAAAMVHTWPAWDLSIYGVSVVGVVLLGWAWFKVVQKAANAGEFD